MNKTEKFLSELPSPVKEQAIHNYRECNRDKQHTQELLVNHTADAILYGFIWGDTKEKSEYWSEVHKKVQLGKYVKPRYRIVWGKVLGMKSVDLIPQNKEAEEVINKAKHNKVYYIQLEN